MSCDAYIVGVSNNLLHVYNCILYFIQYYVLHCIDPSLKINVSKLFVFYAFICC